MANIALRSPQFFSRTIPSFGVQSSVCTITVDSVIIYSLTKNVVPNTTVNFEVSELVRDYLIITFQFDYIPQSVAINITINNYSEIDGAGNVVGGSTFNEIGYEAYGTFEEGSNPISPNRPNPTFLIPLDYSTTPPTYNILAPTGYSGHIPYIGASGAALAISYNANAGSIPVDGISCAIKRIDCTKYGEGTKIIYINKYGVQQDLWFFLKQAKSLARKNESYKANTITYPTTHATYSTQDAPNKVFHTQANQTHKLSSGYYPEYANQFFEELLLSEYVWMERPKKTDPATLEIIPVKVKTSSMKFKTSVNDRLLEYTIDFEEAYDYINNIR
jgi:hypothetical protein